MPYLPLNNDYELFRPEAVVTGAAPYVGGFLRSIEEQLWPPEGVTVAMTPGMMARDMYKIAKRTIETAKHSDRYRHLLGDLKLLASALTDIVTSRLPRRLYDKVIGLSSENPNWTYLLPIESRPPVVFVEPNSMLSAMEALSELTGRPNLSQERALTGFLFPLGHEFGHGNVRQLPEEFYRRMLGIPRRVDLLDPPLRVKRDLFERALADYELSKRRLEHFYPQYFFETVPFRPSYWLKGTPSTMVGEEALADIHGMLATGESEPWRYFPNLIRDRAVLKHLLRD
ncbi:MAG: hypothetical protein N3E40_01415 [Dehalococcoidia bacterium]|nr:hypothetical protein [Dehalococcoidia bacterium]